MNTKVSLSHAKGRKLPYIVRWFGDVDHETGKQRRYSRSFKHSREAKAFQIEKQADLNRGSPRDEVKQVTLGQVLEEFTESRLAGLSYSSQEAYRRTMEQLRAYFDTTHSLRLIDQRRAEAFIVSRKRARGSGGNLSSWTLYQHRKHCRAIWAAAVAWKYVDRNPFVCPKEDKNSPLRIRGKSRPWQHIVPAEFTGFIAKVPTARQRAAYWLMYGCGLRPGEVYNLTADCVDLDERRVHVINRAPTADAPPFTIKADGQSAESKERSVPIPQAAMPDLTEALQQAFKSGGFIALSATRYVTVQQNWRLCRAGEGWAGHGHRPWQTRDLLNNILRETKRYLRKANIEITSPFTMTTLRKSFGQNHANAGTPPKTLAKLMGHSDVSVTMEFYNRVTDANEREAARTMDQILGGKKQARRSAGA
ncbi:MAG: site-specific integrase [Phycisphaerales bacterium]|nr:MAG: site-specific integrase [Phycisphaerales bacterium]